MFYVNRTFFITLLLAEGGMAIAEIVPPSTLRGSFFFRVYHGFPAGQYRDADVSRWYFRCIFNNLYLCVETQLKNVFGHQQGNTFTMYRFHHKNLSD